MSRKPTKGYFVRGQFVAEGSELDLELKRELKGSVDMSKTDLKKESDRLQLLGENLLTLNAGLMTRLIETQGLSEKLIDAVADAKRITDFLRTRVATLDDPRSLGEALKGSRLGDFWKYRVGDYRIICDIQDGKLIVLVVEIGHRSSVYR